MVQEVYKHMLEVMKQRKGPYAIREIVSRNVATETVTNNIPERVQ